MSQNKAAVTPAGLGAFVGFLSETFIWLLSPGRGGPGPDEVAKDVFVRYDLRGSVDTVAARALR